jgi:small subunit ribosomal protein S5
MKIAAVKDEDIAVVIEEEIKEVKKELTGWQPKTAIGMKVRMGEIKTIDELMEYSTPIKEVEIIDALLPDLEEEVIDVARVQRTTDSGRRMRFRVVAAVGNRNGYVGVGKAKGKEAGPTIKKAIERAKLNIMKIKRGCGSWECMCGKTHTVPFKVTGDSGSVRVTLMPAPRGTGIVSGETAKKIVSLAGVSDVWAKTEGYTRSNINFAFAVLDALANTNKMKLREKDAETLKIVAGKV